MASPLRIIGLTGGIATGKSSVARYFAERGIPVIDADLLARQAVEAGTPALTKIVENFGRQILASDGSLDRKQLARQVFADPEQRKILENILHPAIKQLAEQGIAAAAAEGHHCLIYMAPLLIEAGASERVTEIWVVTVRPEIQLQRLMARDAIDQAQAEKIISSQMPLADKERYGSIVIDNSGTPEATSRQLEAIWNKEIAAHHE